MGSLFYRAAAAGALAAGLAACQAGGGGLLASGGSPTGKPIAVESIEGLPPAVRTALTDELASAAASRRVELVGTGDARYRVRGYLSAEPSDSGGTQLAFVWDVFDAQKRRTKRVTGTSPIRSASLDGLDKETLRKLAADSMDELATFLSASAAAPAAGAVEPEPDAS
jgi:hypothetical protein